MQPAIGDTLLYSLTSADCHEIAERLSTGFDRGNPHFTGQYVPLIVVQVWPNEFGTEQPGVNGQAIIDGNFSLWITSAREGVGHGEWMYQNVGSE